MLTFDAFSYYICAIFGLLCKLCSHHKGSTFCVDTEIHLALCEQKRLKAANRCSH